MMAFSYVELWSFKAVKLDVSGNLVLSDPVTNKQISRMLTAVFLPCQPSPFYYAKKQHFVRQ